MFDFSDAQWLFVSFMELVQFVVALIFGWWFI